MEMNEYQTRALITMKKWDKKEDQIINAILGLSGESGEICELFKHVFLGTDELDKDKLLKELGDIMWYIAEMCDAYGFTMQDVADRNLEKLSARHGSEFSGIGNRTGEGL